ncbi:MAG TPA: hypothetical protein VK338_06000, partial [Candidatus Nitrosocosmicus sp.]|nr:hypothetical protein [Candidatus Nitrosocosmicus sp.]
DVEQSIPAKEKMLEDIKMMNFKIRPVSGDIFSLAKREIGFVESLWKLGRIEQIIEDKIDTLDESEQDVFLNYLDDIQLRTQKDIASKIEKLPKREQQKMRVLEFEIFKDRFVDQTKLN